MSLNRNEIFKMVSSRRNIIKLKTENNVVNSDAFNQLLSLLVSFSHQTPISAFAFHFSEDDLRNLDFEAIKSNLNEKIAPELNLKNFFIVNNRLEVSESQLYNPVDSIEAKEMYKKMSENRHCIVLIFDKVHSVFFDGYEITTSLFLAEADLKKWARKRDIGSLFEVLKEYKVRIKDRSIYHKFFIEKSIAKRLTEVDKLSLPKNLLRNKPEGILRDDLKNFLQESISRTFNFSRESLLDSNDRLDINTEDEQGNYYFLEIKWVGKSLNATATGFGKVYDDKRPQEGMLQTLGYIAQLSEMKKTVKLGCLVVFDARDKKTGFVYDFTKVTEESKKYISLYKVVDDLHLDNESPL
jgi:hypothetical protein